FQIVLQHHLVLIRGQSLHTSFQTFILSFRLVGRSRRLWHQGHRPSSHVLKMHFIGYAIKVERRVANVVLSYFPQLDCYAVDGFVGHLFSVIATSADEDFDDTAANYFVPFPGLIAVWV